MNLFVEYFKMLFGIKPNDWSVIWSKSTKWTKENCNIINITYCIIYYSESRDEFHLEVKGKYSSNLLCYKQALRELEKLNSTIEQ